MVTGAILIVAGIAYVALRPTEPAPLPGEAVTVGGSAANGAGTARDWLQLFSSVAQASGQIASAVESGRAQTGGSTSTSGSKFASSEFGSTVMGQFR